jgi:hypothetical protein
MGDDEARGGFYVSMLEQDISHGLMPIGGRIRKTYQPCARLLSGDAEAPPEVQEMVADAMATNHDSLASSVSERVNQTAAAVAAHGRAIYEIAYYRRGQTPVAFVLFHLDPRFVFQVRASFVQRIPPGIRIPAETLSAETTEITDHERPLDPNRLLVTHWPPDYKDVSQRIRELKWSRVPYDFERFREAQERALGASTRPMGWNARGLFDRTQTGYYYCARELRFQRLKITLRDHIVSRLNWALERAGQQIGFQARVLLEGLPTLSDVVRAEELLAAGETSFKEIIDRFTLYG